MPKIMFWRFPILEGSPISPPLRYALIFRPGPPVSPDSLTWQVPSIYVMEQTDLSFYPLVIEKLVLFSYRSHPFCIIIMFFTGSISTAEGSALVKLGNTTVVCGVKAVSHQHSDL